jgi:hypothetical protein
MVQPWADAGYLCYCVDTQHHPGENREGNIIKVGADVTDYLPPRCDYAIAFAFPPCTDLAVSGALHFKHKGLPRLIDALGVVESCRRILEWTGAPWMLENPVSTISSYWRQPDFIFNPCDYGGYLSPPGDAYTKRTCLWTGGAFAMPTRKPVPVTQSNYIRDLPKGPMRATLRAETPMGFARAVFAAHHPQMNLEAA